MNENYLLNNEAAKKLYFEYAKNLPTLYLYFNCKVSEKPYDNITQAFIWNDYYKLFLLDNSPLNILEASDYTIFKEFCNLIPKLAMHPIYILAHIELKENFDCQLEINGDNCDAIWYHCNDYIKNNDFSDFYVQKKNNCINIPYLDLNGLLDKCINDENITDLESFENAAIKVLTLYNENGCKRAHLNRIVDDFNKPNPYQANLILQRIRERDKTLIDSDLALLEAQALRTIGIKAKEMGWKYFSDNENWGTNGDLFSYLAYSSALPELIEIVSGDFIASSFNFSELISKYAHSYPIGDMIFHIESTSPTAAYARYDYYKRILCNLLGEAIENGEYTSDESTVKKIIEDILYNNLKEAIK